MSTPTVVLVALCSPARYAALTGLRPGEGFIVHDGVPCGLYPRAVGMQRAEILGQAGINHQPITANTVNEGIARIPKTFLGYPDHLPDGTLVLVDVDMHHSAGVDRHADVLAVTQPTYSAYTDQWLTELDGAAPEGWVDATSYSVHPRYRLLHPPQVSGMGVQSDDVTNVRRVRVEVVADGGDR